MLFEIKYFAISSTILIIQSNELNDVINCINSTSCFIFNNKIDFTNQFRKPRAKIAAFDGG